MSVSIGTPANARFYATVPELPSDKDVYFGVAARRSRGDSKEDVLGTNSLWVDADDLQKPLATFPPSAIVMSGHGYHLYWFLKTPLTDIAQIEYLNQLLAKDVPTADPACWNANRVLRVPGTVNTKDVPVNVTLVKFAPEIRYAAEDFNVLAKLSKAARHKIRTGDSRGYRSRSERDWAIVTDLINAGASDDLILQLFAQQPCGDKVRGDAPPQYLERTIEKARASNVVEKPDAPSAAISTRVDGYYVAGRHGQRRISTFVISPKLLLDGSSHKAEDAIVGDVTAEGFTWQGVTFSRTAFTSVQKMDRETPVAAWQWLGSDNDVRQLLPHLLTQLQERGLPRVVATPVLGLHSHKEGFVFVGTDGVLSDKMFWSDYTGPMSWLPTHKEHPVTKLEPRVTPEQIEFVRSLLPKINEAPVLWLMTGWYAAASVKPWLEEQGYRFPILSVVGTKGSGKTTLIQRVFMPLFGQTEPKSYDAGTTRFVTLAILGSSNAVPVAFSEFRYESAEKFLRYVLLSYDTGHDPRGRGDQTTVDYPLLAPFSIDGEDLIADPAARERIVVAHLHPSIIAEGTSCYEAFNRLRGNIPAGFGGFYHQEVIRRLVDGTAANLLREARESIFAEFPSRLPDRVRNNHIVDLFGTYLWCDIVQQERPLPSYLNRSVQTVFSLISGRSRTMADDFVEDVVNSCSMTTTGFKWAYEEGCVFFQMAPAHSWWLASRRRQGRGGLEREAIKAQLAEAPYYVAPRVVNGAWMVGVQLEKAQLAGLDVPAELNVHEITVRF